MANAIYGLGLEKFLNGQIDWTDDNIKVSLIDTGSYTVAINTDEYYDDIPGGAIIATSSNLSGKTSTLGVADANDVTFSSVSGNESEALVIWKDSGVSSTSPLIAYIDTATGLPVTPNGGDITITWSSGATKIFQL